jgi:type III pantothenate kinase
MTVVLDIGNARLKWARLIDGNLSEFGEVLHSVETERALASFAASLEQPVTRIIGTNVAGDTIARRIDELAAERWGVNPEWVAAAAEQLGVTCGYANPQQLGADRWVAVLAAYERAGGAACVVDVGTALTVDIVDDEGTHFGGLIMAGPRLAVAALGRETSNIAETGLPNEPPAGMKLMGRSTDDAVAHGAMLGVAAAVDRALRVANAALAVEPLVFLTGGDAPLLLPWLESTVQYQEHLVLEGLALLAEHN